MTGIIDSVVLVTFADDGKEQRYQVMLDLDTGIVYDVVGTRMVKLTARQLEELRDEFGIGDIDTTTITIEPETPSPPIRTTWYKLPDGTWKRGEGDTAYYAEEEE